MSNEGTFDIDTCPARQPRQNRIHSIGFPTQTSLLPDPPSLGTNIPAISRRHSAAPMVSAPPIPLRPPAIPKRSKNERPIPIIRPSIKSKASLEKQAKQHATSSSSASNFATSSSFSAWNQPVDDKLIDLDNSKKNEFPADYSANVAFNENNFVANFDQMHYVQTSTDASALGFQHLEKTPRDFDKRLQENVINVYDPTLCNVRHLEQLNSASQNNRGKIIRQHQKREEEGQSNERIQSRIFQPEDIPNNRKPHCDNELRTSESSKDYNQMENLFQDKSSKFEELQKTSYELEKRLGDFHGKSDNEEANAVRNLKEEIKNVEKFKKIPKSTQTNLPPPLNVMCQNSSAKPTNVRQDSNISSDSFSQTSSPSYTNKTMEAPLLPQKHVNGNAPGSLIGRDSKNPPTSPIIKSMSTPASLQAIVKFHNGSNMSLHNRIIKDIRRPSSHYVIKGRLRFRFAQILVNAIALLIITGGLALYFKTYPENSAKMKNRTLYAEIIDKMPIASETIIAEPKNPSPGVCLPVIVSFCLYYKIPYNFTVFPNYMNNFNQRDAQHDLQLYEAIVDVKCYELAALFLCSIFAPKCGSSGHTVPPCRSLCHQTMRRCGFFLEVFGLTLPEYLKCDLFPESANTNICVGHREVKDATERADRPACKDGFKCDNKRCIPLDWHCDGHVDCEDMTDELNCECANVRELPTITREENKRNNNTNSVMRWYCGERKCLSPYIICDGVMDCPWGQDERNCLRLSERNGDIASGQLEVYHAEKNTFIPACITNWDESITAQDICSHLGYSTVISSILSAKDNSTSLIGSEPEVLSQSWKFPQRNTRSLLKAFQSCGNQKNHRTVDLICSEYVCGRRRHNYGNANVRTRIVGGVEVSPGDWPFLAALLGGPEQVFYCAGVLISDQWVLTASHCVGNYSNVSGWTIQLGITRRNAHTYLGQKLKVKRVVPHPSYNLDIPDDNDVALFQLANKVEFHEHLRPVCLPKANEEIKPQTICTVIGWGKKNDTESSEYEAAVNEVEVPVLPRDVCNSWLQHKHLNVTDGMICAGYDTGEKDACQGDSGGPLLCRDKNDHEKWFVGGIVSWGIKCAYPKLPGVYAYVPKYVPWIQKEIAKYSDNNVDFN